MVIPRVRPAHAIPVVQLAHSVVLVVTVSLWQAVFGGRGRAQVQEYIQPPAIPSDRSKGRWVNLDGHCSSPQQEGPRRRPR